MKQTHTSVTALAEVTGIPKARIYKWLDEKAKHPSKPKLEDATILEKWIKGEKLEKVPRETIAEDSPYNTISQLAKAILQHAETINSQQYVIRRYIEREPKKGPPQSSTPLKSEGNN